MILEFIRETIRYFYNFNLKIKFSRKNQRNEKPRILSRSEQTKISSSKRNLKTDLVGMALTQLWMVKNMSFLLFSLRKLTIWQKKLTSLVNNESSYFVCMLIIADLIRNLILFLFSFLIGNNLKTTCVLLLNLKSYVVFHSKTDESLL